MTISFWFVTFETNLARECVAVIDDWLSIITVPAIQLHAPAARQQITHISVHRGIAFQLIALKICVVRRGDPVVRQRPGHIHMHQLFRWSKHVILS